MSKDTKVSSGNGNGGCALHMGEDCINDKGSEATWGKSLQKPN